ncbi:hypothetical protein ACFOD4_21640, partial [Pseudoroseomonas globiformis]
FAGELALVLRATAREASGDVAVSEAGFTVRVAPVVDGAALGGAAAGLEDSWIPLEVAFGVSPDPSEHWDGRVLIHGVPEGAALSHGAALGGGVWAVEQAALAAGQVALRPPAHSDAPIALRVEAVMHDTDGAGASRTIVAEVAVTVRGVADAPEVAAADVAGLEDGAVALELRAALADRDGSEVLELRLEGVPDGAVLSAGTRGADGAWVL